MLCEPLHPHPFRKRARTPQQERDVDGILVQEAVTPHSVDAEPLPVVGGEDDGRLVEDVLISQRIEDPLQLAVEVAEAVIGEALTRSSKELLDHNLKRCLDILGGSGKVIVRINPSDYEFAESELLARLGKESDRFAVEFEPDPLISPGGCFVETEGGAIDARVESQVEQLKNSFLQLV